VRNSTRLAVVATQIPVIAYMSDEHPIVAMVIAAGYIVVVALTLHMIVQERRDRRASLTPAKE